MIDTDKYEGHTPAPWYWDGNLCNDEYSDKHGTEQWAVLDWELGVGDADKQLIADAPLLLAEVKRLKFTAANLSSIIYDTELAGQKLWEEKEELKAVLGSYEADPETTGGMLEDLRAEVKRLREQLDNVRYWVSGFEDEHMMSIFKMWIGEEE